ncbi:hypothetical protein BGAL_0215g00010 [Botrytis galanthina]|uniref:Uncharacterized protein n=1 Tax=Botrytis galanthina TaxID=278940 RepID=A0A4S8QUN1_9HELO|nr:hypothetical protein BGAL_0215g00010 [Botrytis galanthina]
MAKAKSVLSLISTGLIPPYNMTTYHARTGNEAPIVRFDRSRGAVPIVLFLFRSKIQCGQYNRVHIRNAERNSGVLGKAIRKKETTSSADNNLFVIQAPHRASITWQIHKARGSDIVTMFIGYSSTRWPGSCRNNREEKSSRNSFTCIHTSSMQVISSSFKPPGTFLNLPSPA